jgi:pimeloyl-ACP methyl ester carboxylesterase
VTDSYKFWLNRVEYPFALREFDSGEGWMNYVDHGRGRAVVFVHGCMTWSYLFRGMIESIGESHRCIAVDHLGFGLSEKPGKVNYHPDGHARRFASFMDQLNLTDITLVVHDAGAPIALDWAAENPDRIRDIVMFNSYMWGLGENEAAVDLIKMVTNPMNKFYYKLLQATPSFILPPLFADRHRMTRATQRQYLRPFMTHEDRLGVYTLVESWKTSELWMDSVREKMGALSAKNILMLWGMKDPIMGPEALERMQSLFPKAQTVEFAESGRFLPEEQSERAIGEIKWLLMNSGNPELSLVKQLGG